MALMMVALAVFFYIKDNSEVTCPLAGDNVRDGGNSTNMNLFSFPHANLKLVNIFLAKVSFFSLKMGCVTCTPMQHCHFS